MLFQNLNKHLHLCQRSGEKVAREAMTFNRICHRNSGIKSYQCVILVKNIVKRNLKLPPGENT